MTDAEWAVIEPLLPAPGWMLLETCIRFGK
jgi:hypothetical protein